MVGSEFALMFGLGFFGEIDLFAGDLSSDSDSLLFLLFVDSWTASCVMI